MARSNRQTQTGFIPQGQQSGYAGNTWNQWANQQQWGSLGQGGQQYGQYTIPAQIANGPNGQPVALVQLTPGTSVKQLVVTTPNGQTQIFALRGMKGQARSQQTQQQGFPAPGSGRGRNNLGQTGQYAMLPGNQQAAIKHLRNLAQAMNIPLQALLSGSGQSYQQSGQSFQPTKQRRQKQTSGRS